MIGSTAARGSASETASPWRALWALAIGYFLIMLDQGLMPVITPHLPAEVSGAVWLTSVYLLFTVVPMPVTGRLGDSYGQRRVYLAGLALYTVSLVLAAASWSWPVLVVARALQGLGSAIFLPQAFGVIGRIFPANGRGKAFGLWGVVGSVGSLLGPIVGGLLVAGTGWRAAFALQAVIAVAGVAAAILWLPRLAPSPAIIPVRAVGLTFVGLTALIYGIQFGFWWLILIGLIALGVLVTLEDSFIPRRLFADRNFTFGTAGIVTMGFAAAAMFIPIMYWLQGVQGLDARMAGILTAPMSLVAMVVTPYAGALSDRVNPKTLCVSGFAVMAATLAGAYALTVLHAHYGWFALVTALLGLGSAFVWAPNATATMRTVADHDAGAASGLYNTLRQVGSVIGVALTGAVLAGGDVAVTAGPAMLLSAGALALGVVVSSFLRPVGSD